TMDQLPGTDHSWVELYNSTDQPIPLDNICIVANGETCGELPKGLVMPSQAILLIYFSKSPALPLETTQRAFKETNSATILLPATSSNGPKRQAGYCAIFAGKPDTGNMLDIVVWGDGSKIPAEQAKQMTEGKMWKGDGVFIGKANPAPGDRAVPPMPA